MKELGEALKLIFNKIGDFFDILDLSFFVSGLTSVGALFAGLRFAGFDVKGLLSSNLGIFIVAVSCYVAGLICFASGRWIRMSIVPKIRRKKSGENFDELFGNILEAHGLASEEPFVSYLNRRKEVRGTWRLYVRLWAEIRHASVAAPSLVLLRRYWVMAATYDGISVAVALWAVLGLAAAFGICPQAHLPKGIGIASAIVLFVFSAACLREANRYFEYQIEEVVACIAASRKKP